MPKPFKRQACDAGLMVFYRHSAGPIGVGIERDTNLIVFKAVALEEKLARPASRGRRRKCAAAEPAKRRRQA
jgi:hypothetical protein